MTTRSIEQGITAIQQGNIEEGARLIRIGLKTEDVSGATRAIAYLWLAETTNDIQTRRQYYDEAVKADPQNQSLRQRVDAWLAAQLPTPPQAPPMPNISLPPISPSRTTSTGTQPIVPLSATTPGYVSPAPNTPNQPVSPFAPFTPQATPSAMPAVPTPSVSASLYHIVGILGGPNGTGSGFFVAREGLLATTRHVVGGASNVTVELEPGRQVQGRVVRSYPEIDLAFVYVQQAVSDLMPITPLPRIPEDMPFTAISYNGKAVTGKRRSTKRVLSPYWFPTDVDVSGGRMPDAGGNPILDDRHYVIGMLTRNTSSTSGFVYALHINAIRKFVEEFRMESTSQSSGVYCLTCGYLSRAAAAGGFYCENCGTIMPQAENVMRIPQPQFAGFYHQNDRISCIHCNATVGFHKGQCLRCGRSAR